MLKVEDKAIEALQEAVEGECHGLAIDHKQAKAILVYVFPFLAHEVDQLRRTRDDLHKANNRYLQEARDARSKNAELEREVERCHARLEIDHEWVMGGNDDSDLERREIPFAERANQIDGIECRDATIHELEREVNRLMEALQKIIDAPLIDHSNPNNNPVSIARAALSTSPQGGEHA